MLRYITEYKLDPAGTTITLDSGVMFKEVHKVQNYFVLVVEVLGNPMPEYQMEIVLRRKDTYIHPKAKYIDSVLVGNELFHFFAQPPGIETEEDSPTNKPKQTAPVAPPPKEQAHKL